MNNFSYSFIFSVSRLNSHMFSSLTLWFQYESLLCQFFHAIWGELPTETANSAL